MHTTCIEEMKPENRSSTFEVVELCTIAPLKRHLMSNTKERTPTNYQSNHPKQMSRNETHWSHALETQCE